MTSTSPQKKSVFSQLKEQVFGNPEVSLKEAYEAASKIKSIENHYFSGYRIPVESLTNEALKTEVQETLANLKLEIDRFNANSSESGKLGSNHLEKLIFAEGILANYSMGFDTSSALVPTEQPSNGPSSATIVDVPASTQPSGGIDFYQKITTPNVQPSITPRTKSSGPLQGSMKDVFNKIKRDLNPKSEEEVLEEFRRSKAITIVGIRFLALLIIIPIVTQQVSKSLFISPIVAEYRSGAIITIDNLNSEWKEEALEELNIYEEQLKMDRLLKDFPPMAPEVMREKIQEEANEIAEEFDHKTTNSISNVFADFLGLFAFAAVLIIRRKDIVGLKSLVDNVIYGLSDSAKAFIIILFTDIFVGFHSTHGWDVLLEGLANHIGVAANPSAIGIFIATVPVVMDAMMKFWIFKYLSQMSASTVATLKEMDD